MVKDYYSIPGMKNEDIASTCMFCEKKATMSIAWHGLFLWGWDEDAANVENIDISPIPVWPDHPDTGPYLLSYPIMVSAYSEHKDEAFQVLLKYVSKENQLNMAKTVSAGPTTAYPEVLESLGEDQPFYDRKNVSAIFSLGPAVGEHRQSTKWDSYVDIGKAIEELASSEIMFPLF